MSPGVIFPQTARANEASRDTVFGRAQIFAPTVCCAGGALLSAAHPRPGTGRARGRKPDAFRLEPGRVLVLAGNATAGSARPGLRPSGPRSEERRVGKECRSRWSPY